MRMRKLSLSLALAAPLAVVAIPNGANTAAADPAHAATRSTTPMPPTAVRPNAVAAPVRSTIDPNSNIRTGPHLNSPIVYTTRALTPVFYYCYEVGDRFNDGRYNTNIWYSLDLVGQEIGGFAWGGNVNTSHDPPPGLRRC